MNIQPRTWWIVFLVLLVTGPALFLLIEAQQGGPILERGGEFSLLARAVLAVVDAVATAWLLFGLIRWREHPVVRRIGLLLGFTVAAQLVAGLFFAFGATSGVIAVTGIWAMVVLFFGGLLLIRVVLTPGHPVLGVARTLVDEAVRMKAPLVFLVALALIVPVLPFVLDSQDQLRYRIQTFLTWSLTATGVLLSLMTIFLAVGSITTEVQHRQIFLTMTKPVSRAGYLFGKWLGVAALNLVLVAVCGAGIYVFTQVLARQPAQSPADRVAVEGQVLVARQTITPRPTGVDLRAVFEDRVARLRATDPATYGPADAPVDALPPPLRSQIQSHILSELFVVPPQNARAFQFTDLAVDQIGATVQLRLKPRPASPSPDGTVFLFLRLNGYEHPDNPIRLAESQYHVLDLDARYINPENGELILEVANFGRPDPASPQGLGPQSSITFDVADGMQLLYRVGGFEGNFVRGLVMLWVRLAFLAMLGIAAAVYLSFPIACLLALIVYFAALGSGFIAESLDSYASFPSDTRGGWEWISGFFGQLTTKLGEGDIGYVIRMFIKLIGSTFMLLVPAFGEYNPTPMVADGRWISPRLLGEATLWVGVIWTGVVAFIAWLLWRRRELARVTV